jgi:branched-chain amino acid transport system ATP-binding protein
MGALDLQVVSVSKRFGGLAALQDVSFVVPQGAVIGIIGPNGSGKTTLFNLCSGMLVPEAGRIFLGDSDITGLKPFQICRLGLGRTFQIVRPFPEMSVLENVVIGALFGQSHRNYTEARKESEEIVRFLKLDKKAHVASGALTLPEKKRLEVARSLATKPRVLLLDEVMAGLTPSEVDDFVDVVRNVNERGITIVIIEHVMRAIMDLAQKIVVLHHGRVIADDLPENIVTNPAVIESYLGEEFGNVARSK